MSENDDGYIPPSESPLGPEGCLFPDKCCMPGMHYESECHTAEDLMVQESMSEKQTSEAKKEYQFWADQAGLVFLRAPDTSDCAGWEDGLYVSHGLSRPTAERLHDELSKILNRTPDPRMVEVLREARQFIQKQNHAVCGNYCESCQLLDRIDALLKGEKPTEQFKEGAD